MFWCKSESKIQVNLKELWFRQFLKSYLNDMKSTFEKKTLLFSKGKIEFHPPKSYCNVIWVFVLGTFTAQKLVDKYFLNFA